MCGSKEQKLEKLVAKKKADAIINLIGGKDISLSLKAIEALGKVPGDESYNELISLIRSPRADIRAAAISALGTLGDPKARAHISHMVAAEKDPVVVEAMKKAMAKLHGNY